jgi:hypothetical protein
VGHDLHRLAEVVAAALTLDDVLVNLARCDVVLAGEGDVEVALVVAEIEVDLAAVGEDENLAVPARCSVTVGVEPGAASVLLGVHGAGIDIEVGVDFDRRDVRTVSTCGGTLRRRHLS